MLIVKSPYRISLFGGGTDFPDYFMEHNGAVLSTAIDKYIHIIVRPRVDNKTRVSCTHIQTTSDVNRLKHELIRECMKFTGMPPGVEIITVGDLPGGSGLGSSSTVTVGLLRAFYDYVGQQKSPLDIAQDACKIELDVLGKPIGVQDQFAASYGNLRKYIFSGVGSGTVPVFESLNSGVYEHLENNLMLFFTGITRKADTILEDQVKKTEKNTETLDEMKGMVDMAVNSLVEGDVDNIGELLDKSWRMKRKLAKNITSKKLEGIYKKAKDAGATGGKVTGAGGGGFFLFYVPGDKGKVRTALSDLIEIPFRFDKQGARVVYNSL